ncbi:MAG TPA: IreB family regulatory phosphoprotein [Firmicutes bacterium]|nr:IreB family regulatory phosphoprotein [Bacillota bacterium]
MSAGVNPQETVLFTASDKVNPARAVLKSVGTALRERGYDPVDQLVGYLLSGDPTYITSFGQARDMIRSVDRDDLLEEIVRGYLEMEGRPQDGQTSD